MKTNLRYWVKLSSRVYRFGKLNAHMFTQILGPEFLKVGNTSVLYIGLPRYRYKPMELDIKCNSLT